MKILAVETATSWLSVAVLSGGHVLGRADEEASGEHAKRLVPAIDRVLTASRVGLSDLEGLAVSIGPGSFTGLRVGLATMLGFRAVTELPLAAVPTLEAMAWNLRASQRLLCPVLRSRLGEVYWAQYRWRPDGSLERVQEERVGSLEELARAIPVAAVMLGEGWLLHAKEVRGMLGRSAAGVEDAPPEAMRASAVSIARAGAERLARGEVAGQGLGPRYIQRAEAELVWERRGGRPSPKVDRRRPGRRVRAVR